MAQSQQNDSLLAFEKERKELVSQILELREKEILAIKNNLPLDKENIKELNNKKKLLADIVEKIKEENGLIKDQVSSFENAASSIKSMSDLQSRFKKELNNSALAGAELASKIGQIGGSNKKSFKEANELIAGTIGSIAELTSLNKEDAVEIRAKTNDIESSISSLNSLITQLEANRQNMSESEISILNTFIKQRQNLQNQLEIAGNQANISKEIKDTYEELYSDLEGLEKTFKKIAITTQIFFSSFKNALGLSLMFVGGLVDDFNELAKGVGGTVTQMFQLKAQSFAVSKLLGDEAGSAVTSLAEKLGDANDVTLKLSLGVGALTGRLGVSGEEAATLVNQFGNLSGRSSEFAMNTLEAASQLASANGVAPAGVMKDIAENTEFFALYSKDGGSNIAEAAIQARKLGVDLSTASKISDNLLDYQSSVQSEMQASVLLGRNLNLNKARELAYANDTAGAMKAALDAAGGISAYNDMDVYQRRAVAEAIGVGADELQKMVANQEKALTPVGQLEGQFNSITAAVQEMGAGITGTAVKGIGGMLIGMKDFKTQVSEAKEGLDFITDSAKGVGSLLSGDKGAGLKDALDTSQTKSIKSAVKGPPPLALPPAPTQTSVAGPLTKAGKPDMRFASNKSVVPKMDTSNLDKTTKSVGGINATDLIKGAAALLIMAAALFVVAKALQEFNTVEPESLLKAGAALVGLGSAMFVLGTIFSNPILAEGLAVATVGILGFGAALALAGVGAKLFGQGFSLVSASLPSIVEQLSALSQVNFLPIFGLAAALTTLGASLALVATTGLAALPVLAGIGFAAGAVGMLFGSGEGGESKNDALLTEIQGLRADIQTQPIIVQLDGRQVYINNLRQQKNKSN
jgi:outer membrane murein-binding lipoprotein Lpp